MLKRSIGLGGLTLIGIGGVLGSGWLFAPLLAAQQAGPASLITWCIGGLAILIIAMPFAEITASLPEAGAIARLPRYSHGGATSMVVGWSAWLGYATQAPIETLAMLNYIGPLVPGIYPEGGGRDAGDLTALGYMVALLVLVVMVVINALGVAWLDKANAIMTTAKIMVPLVIVLAFVSVDFHPENFTAQGGFAPYGLAGILTAVSGGGVMFAFLGFRHIIDLAGEARRPHFNIPYALFLSVFICFAIYILVQLAFIGGLPQSALAGGWSSISFQHHLGPLAGIAAIVGMSWLTALLYGAAVVGPFGTGLISTGSNARLGMALALNEFFPPRFARISDRGVPLNALVAGFAVGVCFLVLPFSEIVALNSSAIVLSLCIGPLAVVALRRQLPDRRRPVSVPMVHIVAPLGFVLATLIVYWSGWNTIWRLAIALAVGLLIYRIRLRLEPPRELVEWRHARWLLAYLAVIGAVSVLGNFGGGLGVLPLGWDMAVLAAGALACYRLGLVDALPPRRTQELVELSVQGP